MNIGMQGGTVVKPPSNISIEPIASLWSRAKTSSLQPFNLHCGRGTSGGGVSARGRAQQALRARACGPLRSSTPPAPPFNDECTVTHHPLQEDAGVLGPDTAGRRPRRFCTSLSSKRKPADWLPTKHNVADKLVVCQVSFQWKNPVFPL